MTRHEVWEFVRQADKKNKRARLRLWVLLSCLGVAVLALAYDRTHERLPNMKSVVRIRAFDAMGMEMGVGSGVEVAPRRILTAAHVVSGAAELWIDLYDGGAIRSVRAEVERCSDEKDLAILRPACALSNAATIGLGAASRMSVGHELYACGASAGLTPTNLTRGYLSSKNLPEARGLENLWQMSTTVFFGNSGGAVFDADTGYLVGIVVRMAAPNVSFFVAADELQGFLDDDPCK